MSGFFDWSITQKICHQTVSTPKIAILYSSPLGYSIQVTRGKLWEKRMGASAVLLGT
jgi:hypothetical protein